MKLNEITLNEGINDRGRFKAVFMVGIPGAGKTFVLSKINSGAISPRVVNTDNMIEYFGQAGIDISNVDGQAIIKDRSKQLTQTQLGYYLNGMLPLIIDGTSSSPRSTFRRIGLIESLGYDVMMVGIITDLDVAKERASGRDRGVDVEFIEQAHARMEDNLRFYKQKFGDQFVTIYNNDGELTDDVILSAYRKTSAFFDSPIDNPIGREKIETLEQTGGKYLEDLEGEDSTIAHAISVWYQS